MTDERKAQLAVNVDSSGAKVGFDDVKKQARETGAEVARSVAPASQAIDGIGAAGERAAEKLDRSTRSFVAQIQRVTAETKTAGQGASARLEALADLRGLDKNALAPYLAQLREVEKGSVSAAASMNTMGMSAKQLNFALRGIGPQFTDIFVGLASGQAPMTVLIQQGGQLKDMFGGIGNAARALGGYMLGLLNPLTLTAAAIGAIAYAYSKGAGEASAFQKTLIETGSAAGVTAPQLASIAESMGKLTGNQHAASAALNEFAKSGRIGADSLERFALAAINLERAGGQSVEKTAAAFADLAREPYKAAVKLDEALNFLSVSALRQIKALEDVGRTTDAARLAQDAYAESINSRTPKMVANLGLIEAAWLRIKEGASFVADAALGVGRAPADSGLANLRKEAADKQARIADLEKLGWKDQLSAAREELGILQQSIALREAAAKGQTDAANASKQQAEAKRAEVDFARLLEGSLSKQTKMRNEIAQAEALGLASGRARADIEQVIAGIREKYSTKGKSDAQKELEAQTKLIAELGGLAGDFASDWDLLIKAWKSGKLPLDQLIEAQAKLLAKQPIIHENANKEAEAAKKAAKAIEDQAKQTAKWVEEIRKAEVHYEKYVENEEEAAAKAEAEAEAVGKTREQLMALTVARLDAIIAMKQQTLEAARLSNSEQDSLGVLQRDIDATIRQRNAVIAKDTAETLKDQREAYATTYKEIASDIADSLLHAAESGKDFFKSLVTDLKRMFSNLVLRPIIQGVMAPIAGGVSSFIYGGSAGAQGMGGSGGVGSIGQNMAGNYIQNSYLQGGTWNSALAGSYASAFGASSFTAAAAGDAYLPAALGAYGTETAGVGALAGEAMASLAAAAPYIAAFVAIAYLAYKAFGQEPGGPKTGGYAFSGTGMTPWNRTDVITNAGLQQGHFTPNQMDSVLQPIADSWLTSLTATVKAYGGTSPAQSAFDIGIDKDPAGKAANRLGIRASVNGKQVYNYFSGDSALGRDDKTLQDALQLESKRALLAAMQASDIPKEIAAVFNRLTASAATTEEIDNVFAFGAAMKSVMDSIGGDVLTDATTAWNNAQKTSVERLHDMGAEVIRLAGAMDGSTSSMQALATASGSYRQAVEQVLQAIRSVAQQAQSLQESLVQTITTSGMDPGQMFNYFIDAANQRALGLGTATSPDQVSAITTDVYSAIGNAFAALPADVRDAYKQPILDFLASFGSGVNQALTNIQTGIIDDTSNPFNAASEALSAAGDKFTGAASKTETAAQVLSDAADRISGAVDSFVSSLPIPVTVRIAGSEVNG